MPRVVRFHECGNANVLKLEELPEEEPAQGEIRIKIKAIGINRAEVALRSGQYIHIPEFPSRLGYEAAGVVDAVGAGVTHVKVGDKVSTMPAFMMGKYGVYGESAILPGEAVTNFPEHLDFPQAASIWMQYLTAYGAIVHDGQLQPGQTLLVTAASSSTGVAAVQIGKYIGAKVIATTRGASKMQFLLNEVGADHVIVTDEEDIAKQTMSFTDGKGADILLDPVSGPFIAKMVEAAGFRAKIYEYGTLYGETDASFPFTPAISKGLTIHTYTLYELFQQPEGLQEGIEFIKAGLASGKLSPIIDRKFSLDQIVEAHEYMESNKQKGKIVVTV